MSLATSNRDGGRTNEAGHLRGVTKGFVGQVLNGLNVSQRGAGANMSVDVAIGDAIIQRSDNTYGHPAWNDAVYNQVIAAADGSNPRRDIIVMYIDYGQTPSTGVANNTNGVVKIKSVPGTAAGSPVDPSNATIQSSVGSGNPFIKLARVRVAAGATSIGNSVIDDLRALATAEDQGGWIYDTLYSWVYASASSFTIAGVDVTEQFPVGTKLAIFQSGSIKYFTVTGATFSTNTTVTIDGAGTYTLTNVPLDKPAYSYSFAPQNFPRQFMTDPFAGYTELGRATATSAVSSLSVANLPAKKYLKIVAKALANGVIAPVLRFNNDSAGNYANRNELNGAADTVQTSATNLFVTVTSAAENMFSETDITNDATRAKLALIAIMGEGTSGAGNAPNRRTAVGKWQNTSVPITRVDLANIGAGNYAAGTELIVYGKD